MLSSKLSYGDQTTRQVVLCYGVPATPQERSDRPQITGERDDKNLYRRNAFHSVSCVRALPCAWLRTVMSTVPKAHGS